MVAIELTKDLNKIDPWHLFEIQQGLEIIVSLKMYKSTDLWQLFRSNINAHTISLDIISETECLFFNEKWTRENLAIMSWEPIEQSNFLGIPNLETLGEEYFNAYIKTPEIDTPVKFLQGHLDKDNPVNDAVLAALNQILTKRENEPMAPMFFIKAVRAYCERDSEDSRSRSNFRS